MEDKSKASVDAQDKTGIEPVSESRRKLTKAGLVATPIVAALSARRAVAGGGSTGGGGTVQCMSQMLSGNASDANGHCVKGKKPKYWCDNPYEWKNTCKPWTEPSIHHKLTVDPGTRFNEIFTDSQDTRKFHEIMNKCESYSGCSDNDQHKSRFCAAMLNSYNIENYVMTPKQIKELYYDSGVSNTDKATFLESTWDQY